MMDGENKSKFNKRKEEEIRKISKITKIPQRKVLLITQRYIL